MSDTADQQEQLLTCHSILQLRLAALMSAARLTEFARPKDIDARKATLIEDRVKLTGAVTLLDEAIEDILRSLDQGS